jgi:hypothetical protein
MRRLQSSGRIPIFMDKPCKFDMKSLCSVEKLGLCQGTLTIEGVGQHLKGGFLEEVGWLASQQG